MTGAIDAGASRSIAARVGVDPIDRVFIAENHDALYYRWREAGVRHRIVVHVDAHHDTNWISPDDPITIANYIRAAIDAGFVRAVFWVVPDPSRHSLRARAAIARHLAQIRSPILSACLVSELPRFDEPVLLDIDVDYLLIPLVRYAPPDQHAEIPWCWPGDLVERLRACEVRTDLVTIAYSVWGGYTPLRWKYLGDELAWRIRRDGRSPAESQMWEPMRDAASALQRGDLDAAEQFYGRAVAAVEDSPAPHFHLAHLYADAGRVDEGAAASRRALSINPSYRTPYSTGLRKLQAGDLPGAEREYRRDLQLDADDPFALAGLGWLAARKRKWTDAERLLRQSLTLNPRQLDVLRLLGRVYCRQRRWPDAERAYTRSIALALSGERSLDAPIVSEDTARAPQEAALHAADPGHADAYAKLSRLAERRGDVESAIANLRISIAGGLDGVLSRRRLAFLYLRRNRRREFLTETRNALAKIPRSGLDINRRAAQRLRQVITGTSPLPPPYSLG